MNMSDCPREQETVALVRAGRWPDGCDDETRAHVATCAHCGESAKIASLLTDDYRAAVRTARVPSSGLVWWRVQRRAREEAARNAARLVTIVQAICVIAGVAIAIAIAAGYDLLAPKELVTIASMPQWNLPLLLAFTIWLTLAPVAVYLAVSRD
jgi:hypothetical protein